MIFMGKIGVGVIGLGGVAEIGHLPWYKFNQNVEIKAVVDINLAKAKRIAGKYGVRKYYTDYLKLLEDKDVEAVSICTPVHLHREHVIMACKYGKHVLVEKPMARDIDECREMITVAEKNNVILMVGFMKRFNPGFQFIKSMLDSGEIGSPHYIDVHWSLFDIQGSEGFRYKSYTGGGVFQDHGSHYIDLSRWWFNDEVKELVAEFNIMVSGREVEDHGVVLLRFRRGGIATIETSRIGLAHPNYGLYERGQIYTTKGGLTFNVPDWTSYELPRISIFNGNDWRTIKLWKNGRSPPKHYMFKREIDHFIHCILNDEQPIVTGYDGLKAIEVINAAYISFLEKRKVSLPLEKYRIDPNIFQRFPRFQ